MNLINRNEQPGARSARPLSHSACGPIAQKVFERAHRPCRRGRPAGAVKPRTPQRKRAPSTPP